MPTYTTYMTMDQWVVTTAESPAPPPFLKHKRLEIVVDTQERRVVSGTDTGYPVGCVFDKGVWNSEMRNWLSHWEEAKDPKLFWTDVFGVTHDVVA